MSSRIVNNDQAGKVEVTFDNLSTTVAATLSRAITQADLDAGRTAITIIGNNQVGICTTTRFLDGKALAVSEDVDSKGNPLQVTVQIAGMMTLNGTTTLPAVSGSCLTHTGKIVGATAAAVDTAGGVRRPIVTNVWDTDRIDVYL